MIQILYLCGIVPCVTSTKWQNMKTTPTLIILEDISIKLLGETLYKVIYDLWHKATQTSFSINCNTAWQKSFPKYHFSSFLIKQRSKSWKLRWVNSTILNNKIWLIFLYHMWFLCQLYWLLFMKMLFILHFDQLETDSSGNIDVSLVACEQRTEQRIYQWQIRNISFVFLCC